MNFLCAIKHAAIDYGIRRRAWVPGAILSLGNGAYGNGPDLYWLEGLVPWDKGGDGRPAVLLGPDKTYDITEEDIKAIDWETI